MRHSARNADPVKWKAIAALGLVGLSASCSGNGTAAQPTAKAACGPMAAPCGGAVAGTWQTADSCVAIQGTLDEICPATTFQAAGVKATLALSYNLDGTYTAKRSFAFPNNVMAQVPASCLTQVAKSCDELVQLALKLAGVPATCTPTTAGGCDCVLQVVSVRDTDQSGTYSVSGSTVTNVYASGSEGYDFCVTGNQLEMSPHGGSLTVKLPSLGPGAFSGSIVLSK